MDSMYRDSFSEPGWMRVVRWFSASFRLGRFFRVDVRLFWLALVVTPLVLLRNAEGLPFVEGATYVAATTLALYFVIWTHEMGHIVAGRRYGIQTPLITLSPLGGLAHMGSGAPTPGKEIVIAAAGPATHLAWLAVVFPLYLWLDWGDLRPESWSTDPGVDLIWTLLFLNVSLLVFNLLPCFPMDGGRILRGTLARRMHPNRATLIAVRVGMVAGVVFVAVGLGLWIVRDDLWGPILAFIGIANLSACKQERLAAEHGPGPYMAADPLQPWQADPEAWKRGASDDVPADPGRLDRWKATREERRRAQAAAEDRALDAEVDRVLDKVSAVGLQGLTAKERAILEQASKRNRGD